MAVETLLSPLQRSTQHSRSTFSMRLSPSTSPLRATRAGQGAVKAVTTINKDVENATEPTIQLKIARLISAVQFVIGKAILLKLAGNIYVAHIAISKAMFMKIAGRAKRHNPEKALVELIISRQLVEDLPPFHFPKQNVLV